MTAEERQALYLCVNALLGRRPLPAEWGRFVETWHWLEVGNGQPDPSPAAWQQWVRWLQEKFGEEE